MSTDRHAGDRPALLLLPGLNNTQAVWDDVLAVLPPAIQAIASDCPALDDVDAIAARLLSGAPARFYVCGFSFGGYVALAMAAREPHRVRGLALVGSSADADSDAQRTARAAAIERARKGEYLAMISEQAQRAIHPENLANERLVRRRQRMVESYGAERFIAHARACMSRPDRSEVVRRLECPLLVTGGLQDRAIEPEVQRSVCALNPHAQYRGIDRCGHLVPMEQPSALAEVLASWVLEHAGNGER